ncbi:unnamed protein product [Linum trigynum]|uniref:Nodulin-like domain-containing protein n=1 Tax=Linum trigynum TaxID=586398 RepID=A0AAV2EFU8_9ROSI
MISRPRFLRLLLLRRQLHPRPQILMNLTQLQLNNLSVTKDGGKAFGLLVDLASDRFSTPILLLIGSIEGLIGCGVQWLNRKPSSTSPQFLCLPQPVCEILKGFVGLSTATFTDLCSAFFSEDPANFLLMLALVPFVVCLAAIFFLREIPPATTLAEGKEEGK